jgi:aromatic ring hydroxylase
MIAGSAAVESICASRRRLPQREEDWAIAFTIPRDAMGLTVVEQGDRYAGE